jgi:hypothetical protein
MALRTSNTALTSFRVVADAMGAAIGADAVR